MTGGSRAAGGRGAVADLIVVGAGVGGLTAALVAAEAGHDVTVLCKPAAGPGLATATAFAQGGVAVCDPADPFLSDPADSVDLHVADTLAAGGGYVDESAARSILADGGAAVRRLIAWGARFDSAAPGAERAGRVESAAPGAERAGRVESAAPSRRLRRTREGGHSVARIVHAGGDATGAEIQRALTAAARSRGITMRRAVVVDLLLAPDGAVRGVRTDCGDLRAGAVVLATGGAGHLYSSTTNPIGSTGDGIALAVGAGAEVADLDFVQFHPTMLFTRGARGRRALVSEAVRGEGAILVASDGASVTAGVHPLGDLAPRDVVARAVDEAMRRTGAPCVYLDARGVEGFARRFPTVTAAVRAVGVDPVRDLIPVVPGAHYLCGGVSTNLEGATTVEGLYAVGETARTGLHGANRLASNSLLEALVMGARVGVAAGGAVRCDGPLEAARGTVLPVADRGGLQDAMSAACGVRRNVAGLEALRTRLDDPRFAPRRVPCTPRDYEDAALTVVAGIVAKQARDRLADGMIGCQAPPVPGERSDGEFGAGERSDGEFGAGERSDGEFGTGERSEGPRMLAIQECA